HVGRAAGGERHHQADRLRGIILRDEERRQDQAERKQRPCDHSRHHGVTPLLRRSSCTGSARRAHCCDECNACPGCPADQGMLGSATASSTVTFSKSLTRISTLTLQRPASGTRRSSIDQMFSWVCAAGRRTRSIPAAGLASTSATSLTAKGWNVPSSTMMLA